MNNAHSSCEGVPPKGITKVSEVDTVDDLIYEFSSEKVCSSPQYFAVRRPGV